MRQQTLTLRKGDSFETLVLQAQYRPYRSFGIRPKIEFPQFENPDPQRGQEAHFLGVSGGRSDLAVVNRASRVRSGIGVPESAIDLQSHVAIREEEVHGNPETTSGIPEMLLRKSVDPQTLQDFPDPFFQGRHPGDPSFRDGLARGEAEFLFRALFARVVPPCQSGLVTLLARRSLCRPPGGGVVVCFQASPPNQTQTPAFVVTRGGAKYFSGVCFHLGRAADGGGSADGTGYGCCQGKAFRPKGVGTPPGAGGLPTVL